jgi:hypothetical protein
MLDMEATAPTGRNESSVIADVNEYHTYRARRENAQLAVLSLRQAIADLYPPEVLRLDHDLSAAGTGLRPNGASALTSSVMAREQGRRAAAAKLSAQDDCIALLKFDRMYASGSVRLVAVADGAEAEREAHELEYAVHLRFLALDLRCVITSTRPFVFRLFVTTDSLCSVFYSCLLCVCVQRSRPPASMDPAATSTRSRSELKALCRRPSRYVGRWSTIKWQLCRRRGCSSSRYGCLVSSHGLRMRLPRAALERPKD